MVRENPKLKDLNYLKEVLLLPDNYINSTYRIITKDKSGEIADKNGNITSHGTSLMFATQEQLGWGDQGIVFGITAGHVFSNTDSGRVADRLILRQPHLGLPDLEIPHVTYSRIDSLYACVFAFKKPENVNINTYSMDNFVFGLTKDDINFARGFMMPADREAPPFMGTYGTPDNLVIPPYSEWENGMHLRLPASRGCSGMAILNNENKIFAVQHALYPTVTRNINDPNKYEYDGYGSFADVIDHKEVLLGALFTAWSDYMRKWR